MKAIIIEDEKVAAERLEQMLLETDPTIEVVAKLGSIRESVKWLSLYPTDLIFLDIQLSDGISFSIFEQVKLNTPVIFTTAYNQYAVKAFELNSIDYLLKPISRSSLKDSLKKYNNLKSAFGIDFQSLLEGIQGKERLYKKRFLIQIGDKIKKIEVSEIAYFFVLEKAIYLRTFEGKSYPLEYSLDKLESFLEPSKFFRINRKYLLNIDCISKMTAYSRGRVKLELKPVADNELDTIVSVDRASDFKAWLNS